MDLCDHTAKKNSTESIKTGNNAKVCGVLSFKLFLCTTTNIASYSEPIPFTYMFL